MAIKTSTFGRVELSGDDAVRFVQHMNEDKPNEYALAAIERAKKTRKKINNGEQFTMKYDA